MYYNCCCFFMLLQQAKDMFDVNVWGSVRMMQAVLPSMRSRNYGYIINLSSTSGRFVIKTYVFIDVYRHTNIHIYISHLLVSYFHLSPIFWVFFNNSLWLYPLCFRCPVSKYTVPHHNLAGIRGVPCFEYYVGSKFALEGISDSMRYSIAPFNISVTNVHASIVKTAFASKVRHYYCFLRCIYISFAKGYKCNFPPLYNS